MYDYELINLQVFHTWLFIICIIFASKFRFLGRFLTMQFYISKPWQKFFVDINWNWTINLYSENKLIEWSNLIMSRGYSRHTFLENSIQIWRELHQNQFKTQIRNCKNTKIRRKTFKIKEFCPQTWPKFRKKTQLRKFLGPVTGPKKSARITPAHGRRRTQS